MPNRLSGETSPYLLQHANNPVDWYPWGPEALDRAKREDRPILLSIGYAACHWCHVMEHESFEDSATAALMNERFVNIKVDREERPDLDGIYMQAVQAMTGHGGWPMTVFLTPDGTPFYGGTYFPVEERHGMPSFKRVLTTIAEAYHGRKEEIARTTGSVREMYSALTVRPASAGALNAAILDRAAAGLRAAFDEENGGFGGAPKFPPTMVMEWLLTRWARAGDESALEMARRTYVSMARGGIYDQIGGGFARYAVDAIWLVPHFEKMLYDNALLVRLGAHLWQASGDHEIRRVTEQTIGWVAREMTAPGGGFYSSYDADSEGHEGKFYVWSVSELDALLGADAALLIDYWGASAGGNFEGVNILHVRADPAAIAAKHGMRVEAMMSRVEHGARVLYDARAARVWPSLDDKILASWNGLMIRALAECGRVWRRQGGAKNGGGGGPNPGAMALAAAEFVFTTMVDDRTGRVFRSAKGGSDARIAGFLEDYASLGLAALALYDLTFEPLWLERARRLGESIRALFWDDTREVLFDTARDEEALIVRPRDISDNAIPSGSSLATELLFRLGTIFGDADAMRKAARMIETVTEPMARHPQAFGHMLCAADMQLHGATEIALIGDVSSAELQELAAAAAEQFVPALVIVAGDGSSGVVVGAELPLLRDRPAVDGYATAYLCRGYVCEAPITNAERLRERLTR